MPPWEMVGPSAKDADDRPSGTSRLLNCFREPHERGTILRPVPGVVPFASLIGALLREIATVDGDLLAVHGGALWRVSDAGATTNLMAVADDPETTVAGLLGQIAVVAGGRYFLRNPSGVASEPAAGAFSSFGSVIVTAGRALLTERDGRRVQWSDAGRPGVLNGLGFATTEQRDDLNVRAALVGGEPWVFKQTCIERWYATGSGFAAIPGGLLDVGLKAFGLLTTIRGGVFFVGSDNRAYRAGPGGALEALSTRVVEGHIAAGELSRVFCVRWEGRSFYVVIFDDRPAWVYDTQTGDWFERATGAAFGPWRAVAAAEAWGRPFVGFYDGRIMEHRAGADDDGEPLVRRVVSSTMRMSGRRFRVSRMELPAQVGTGVLDTDGPPVASLPSMTAKPDVPHVALRFSRDDGRTWSAPQPRSLGAEGESNRRVVWNALGQFHAFTAELTCSEPLDVSFDAMAYVEVA